MYFRFCGWHHFFTINETNTDTGWESATRQLAPLITQPRTSLLSPIILLRLLFLFVRPVMQIMWNRNVTNLCKKQKSAKIIRIPQRYSNTYLTFEYSVAALVVDNGKRAKQEVPGHIRWMGIGGGGRVSEKDEFFYVCRNRKILVGHYGKRKQGNRRQQTSPSAPPGESM